MSIIGPGRIKPPLWVPGRNPDAMNLWRGCIGYWPLWSGVGTKAWDVSGYSRTATITDAPWTTGQAGIGLDCSAVTARMDGAITPPAALGTILVVGSVLENVSLNHYFWDTDGSRFLCYVNSAAAGKVGVLTNGTDRGTSTNALPLGRHVVILTWPDNVLWIDGTLFYDYADGVLGSVSDLNFFERYGHISGSLGGIAELAAVWDRALCPNEIAALSADPFIMIRPPEALG